MPSRGFVPASVNGHSMAALAGRTREGESSGRPARLALALAAANHALPAQVVARLGDHGPLARVGPVAEANDDPVARQPETIGQGSRRKGGTERPLAVSALQDGNLVGRGAVPRRQAWSLRLGQGTILLVDRQEVGNGRLAHRRLRVVFALAAVVQGLQQPAESLGPDTDLFQAAIAGGSLGLVKGRDPEFVAHADSQAWPDSGQAGQPLAW